MAVEPWISRLGRISTLEAGGTGRDRIEGGLQVIREAHSGAGVIAALPFTLGRSLEL